jgi:hypothetical protein
MPSIKKLLQAAAGNAGGGNLYVEDVFSTYLYEGNSSTQTITNGIDLDGEGGLVWLKIRPVATSHVLVDTERGASSAIFSDSTDSEQTGYPYVTSFNSDGFTLGNMSATNDSSYNYASWTFRKAEKFFDVVTYTGNGTTQEISHNLGSTPACIIVKNTQSSTFWAVYHGSIPAFVGFLNATNAFDTSNTQNFGNNTSPVAPTDSVFTVGQQSLVNSGGETYVAYLFASDAGGFGDDGDESIIKCGSFTTDSSAVFYENLGFEPQWVLVKRSDGTSAWNLLDNMRGFLAEGIAGGKYLRPNTNGAEGNLSSTDSEYINATGFGANGNGVTGSANATFIYIAIRRPMKTPESGTEVFDVQQSITTDPNFVTGFNPDMTFSVPSTTASFRYIFSRLTGTGFMETSNTNAESTGGAIKWDYSGGAHNGFTSYYGWNFCRATGFFDVVAYTGDGTLPQNIAHNLGVIPELMIVRSRNLERNWATYNSYSGATQYMNLNTDAISNTSSFRWYNTEPTSTVFSVGGTSNTSGDTYIAYLFATLAGVSKVGSYTGTGATLNVDCGFSAGARFILIKRTDSTGDWYVYDSVRGIVVGNDPYLLLNTTAAQVTSTDYIDPLSSGFTVTSSAPAALNASGGTYIFLAIA